MWKRLIVAAAVVGAGLFASVTYWIASPGAAGLQLAAPLRTWTRQDPSLLSGDYSKDFAPLVRGFRSQVYRSFCGPASLATVLRAYGVQKAEQTAIFPSMAFKLNVFYTGMSLAELGALARSAGLRNETVYADTLSLEEFRNRLKENLGHEGDFVVVNYDRRVLKQAGGGHISPVAAYDERQDAFLVLDEASYKYPFTWIPAPLLYDAVHTRDGGRFRGVLFIRGYSLSG